MAEYKDDSFFFSLPLLTLITENSVRKNMWIFWPVGYRSKEEKIKEPNRYTNIFSRDLEKVNPYNFV